jgi:hypothetical protein
MLSKYRKSNPCVKLIHAGGTTEEDDALLEETLCKSTNDDKSEKWRTMNYWEEKLWY